MEDSFFGFNTSLPGLLDEELHDEPGQGLDEEEEEEYDALNDETFGTDAVEGDWEEDHEKLAEITEQSRARSGSYGVDGREQGEDSEPDTGLELEASLAQLLVLDDYEEDVVVENGGTGTKLQKHRHTVVEDENYSSSAPSGFSVWGPGKHENQLHSTHPVTSSILPVKNVVSVEELERGLLSQQHHNQQGHLLKQQHQQSPLIVPPPPGLGPPTHSSVLRLEDVERDLTANATLPHMGRGLPMVHHPDLVMIRNSQNATAVASMGRGQFAGRLPPASKAPVLPLGRGQMMLPSGRLMGPPGVHPGLTGIPDLRQLPQQNHRLIGSAPNLLRFIPPHLMVPSAQGPGGKGMPHPGGFPGDNGLLFPNHPLGAYRPGLPHVDQHRHGGQGSYGLRQDRQGPFFSNNRNGGLNSNYQHIRGAHHHHYYHNWGSNYSNQDYDEYAGLMTTREKHWLLNIQLLQLNTDRPHIDDYYYTVYQSRQPKSELDKERERNRDVQRERRDSFRDREGPRQDAQPRVYTPAQFENSLGKLQIGSVTAPRKIIDMDVVSHEGMDSVPTSNQRDTKKAKQMLLEIERLYLLLLQVEDLSSSVPGIKESVTEEKPVLIQRIMSSLLIDDRIVSIMSIRKGKMLLLRLLPHLPATDNGPPQLLTFWCRILRGLVTIGRRDHGSDAVLPRFHPYFHSWVATLPFAPILQLVCSMLPSQIERPVSTPTRTTSPVGRNVLSYALSNKFGVSALASILNRVEELFQSLDSNQQHDWKSFLGSLFETAAHLSSPEKLPLPLEPLDVTIAIQHLRRHECAHIERYALLEYIFTRRDSTAASRDKSNE